MAWPTVPTLIGIHGFEDQMVPRDNAATMTSGSGVYGGALAGTATIAADAPPGLPGTYSLRLNCAAATISGLLWWPSAASRYRVTSFYIKVASQTSTTDFYRINGTTTNNAALKRISGNWQMGWVTSGGVDAGVVSTGPAATLGQWYRIDVLADFNSKTIDWMVDGVAQTQATHTTSESGDKVRYGQNASATWDVYIDHHVVSATNTDYPIGPHYVVGYVPNADGSHSVGTGTFKKVTNTADSSGTTITNSDTDCYTYVNEKPPDDSGTGTDKWLSKTAGTTATDRVEVAFEDTVENKVPWAVRATYAVRNDSGTQANSCVLRLTEGSTEHATDIRSGAIGVATTQYGQGGALYTTKPSGGAWTIAAFNDIRIRFLCIDVAPVPRVKALELEVAYGTTSPPPAPLVLSPLRAAQMRR